MHDGGNAIGAQLADQVAGNILMCLYPVDNDCFIVRNLCNCKVDKLHGYSGPGIDPVGPDGFADLRMTSPAACSCTIKTIIGDIGCDRIIDSSCGIKCGMAWQIFC